MRVQAKIRYGAEPAEAYAESEDTVRVIFEKPQRDYPGQAVVYYQEI